MLRVLVSMLYFYFINWLKELLLLISKAVNIFCLFFNWSLPLINIFWKNEFFSNFLTLLNILLTSQETFKFLGHGTFVNNIRISSLSPVFLDPDQCFHFGASTRRYFLREKVILIFLSRNLSFSWSIEMQTTERMMSKLKLGFRRINQNWM